MGISGHILGPRKLRKLNRQTGLRLDRAYIRNREAEGVSFSSGGCTHYLIDPDTGKYVVDVEPFHWTSCRLNKEETK